MKHISIFTVDECNDYIKEHDIIYYVAFRNIDFNQLESNYYSKDYKDCLFLGCTLPQRFVTEKLTECLIFPSINVPYNVFIPSLYTPQMLYKGYMLNNIASFHETFDQKVYKHYIQLGKETTAIQETLARRLHDHSISDALNEFLSHYQPHKLIAIMGGHSIERSHKSYIEIARISKCLTEKGYLMLSGGGPGAMEATHLGAWMADRSDKELQQACTILAEASKYDDMYWLDKAFEVMSLFPQAEYESIGIPTWFYGHEPATPFATRIAKYFENSIREEGLLAIAKGGIIFTPGNAGTIQEIFQDANQNHYVTFGIASPMIFYNSDYWTNNRPIYPLLKQLSTEGKYNNLILSLCDTKEQIIESLEHYLSTISELNRA